MSRPKASRGIRPAARPGVILLATSLMLSAPGVAAGSPSPAVTAVVTPQAAGSFSVIGTVGARDIDGGRTQTLLPDGRVLIIDGETATLWDPTSRALSPAGELRSPREWSFTSTLLPDGRVMVAGGVRHGKPRANGSPIHFIEAIEVWDPATTTFEAAGRLATGRVEHAALLLPSGGVLIVGGQHDIKWITTGEVHWPGRDPVATVAIPRQVVEGRGPPEAAVLADGRVLMTGGYTRDGRIPMVTWDPTTGHIVNLTPVDVPPPAVPMPLPDGRILIVGTGAAIGCTLMGPCLGQAGARVWDPATDQSTPLFERTAQVSVTVLPDGRVLAVWGSISCDGGSLSALESQAPCVSAPASAEVWDLTSLTATALDVDPATMEGLGQGALLADGRVLVGGAAAYWIIDPVAGSIRSAGPLPPGIEVGAGASADVVALRDGRTLLVGEGGTVAVWTPKP